MKKEQFIKLGLILLVVIDLVWAWFQYSGRPIDGDLYAIVLPAPWYAQVLKDPLGYQALSDGMEYRGAGRSSAHFFMYYYFNHVPLLFQYVVSPVKSIYYSAALIQITSHLGVLFLLGAYVCGHLKVLRKDFLWTMVAATPFLQFYGLETRFGLVDKSITYTCFYILPVLLFLILLYPLYQYALGRRQVGKVFSLGIWSGPWLLGMVILAFWSPQLQTLMVLVAGLGWISLWVNGLQEHTSLAKIVAYPLRGPYTQLSLLLVGTGLLAIYGYIVGLNNSENVDSLPLAEAVIQAAKGIKYHFVEPWPIWVALFFFLYHLYRLRGSDLSEAKRWRRLGVMLAIGVGIYMFLIPFGGYRPYRPFLYRFDLLIPVTLSWVFGLLLTGRLIIQGGLLGSHRQKYLALAAVFGVVLYAHDLRIKKANVCEKTQLYTLQNAQQDTVVLSDECTVLGWEIDTETYYTEKKVKLLQRWKILDRQIVYYQK